MVKVINPLLSFDARGSIKKTLTYSKNQHGNVVKSFLKYSAKRKNAPSVRQIQIQENFKNANLFYSYATNEEINGIYKGTIKKESIERNAVMQPIMKKRPSYLGLFFAGDNTLGSV